MGHKVHALHGLPKACEKDYMMFQWQALKRLQDCLLHILLTVHL